MNEKTHTVLCVDDERNILTCLNRLLRKENYRLLTASSGEEGLELLANNAIHLVMSDQRMPGMNGTDFLAKVKEIYPDIVRIILTGYTEIDSIMNSINQGSIYKFFLKPWNDEHLKLEINKALDQYDLVQANRELNQTIMVQNEELKQINDNLEETVHKRTHILEIQNKALELSRAILNDIPLPVIGVSDELTIAFINHRAQALSFDHQKLSLGESIADYFSEAVVAVSEGVVNENNSRQIKNYTISGKDYTMDITPLSSSFKNRGFVITLNSAN